MANTGIKQAVIAYKVNQSDGAPLDLNGDRISDSGRKQAIALLYGVANPDPSLYEIETYFSPDESIFGVPTGMYMPYDCAAGVLYISPSRLVFNPENVSQKFTVTSSNPWRVYDIGAAIAGIFTLNPSGGVLTVTEVLVTLANPTQVGQGFITLINDTTNQTAQIKLINVLEMPWILEDGTWNNLGFWFNEGIWNY